MTPHRGRLLDRDRLAARRGRRGDGRRAVVRHLPADPRRDAGAQGALRRPRDRRSRISARSPARRCPAPAARTGRIAQGRVTLSWPLDNMGPSLPNLVAAVAGNLFELKQFSGLRLLDLRLPRGVRRRQPRPAVRHRGHAAARRRRGPAADRHHRQALGRARRRRRRPRSSPSSAAAGLDFVKDDELQGDGPVLPVRGAGAGGDGGHRPVRRPDGPEAHVRLQRHRRDRRDAPAPRPRAGARRHLRHGEPDRRRARRPPRARAATRRCRSTPTATAGAR